MCIIYDLAVRVNGEEIFEKHRQGLVASNRSGPVPNRKITLIPQLLRPYPHEYPIAAESKSGVKALAKVLADACNWRYSTGSPLLRDSGKLDADRSKRRSQSRCY